MGLVSGIGWSKYASDIAADPKYAGKKKVAIMSHISSYPSVLLPVNEAVSVARSNGFTTIIDGAHCLGTLNMGVCIALALAMHSECV